MALQLALTHKTTGERVNLVKVDEEIANAVGDAVHPERWCRFWMDTVGFSLACGKSFVETREYWADRPELLEVIDYLENTYNNTSYGV